MMYDSDHPVYEVAKRIPKGRVASYKDVAKLAGMGSPRWVGRILHYNPDPRTIPCHRVVHEDGRLAPSFAFGGDDRQKKLLTDEGVGFKGDRVMMKKFRFRG